MHPAALLRCSLRKCHQPTCHSNQPQSPLTCAAPPTPSAAPCSPGRQKPPQAAPPRPRPPRPAAPAAPRCGQGGRWKGGAAGQLVSALAVAGGALPVWPSLQPAQAVAAQQARNLAAAHSGPPSHRLQPEPPGTHVHCRRAHCRAAGAASKPDSPPQLCQLARAPLVQRIRGALCQQLLLPLVRSSGRGGLVFACHPAGERHRRSAAGWA